MESLQDIQKTKKIALGYRKEEDNPWANVKVQVGDIVEGKVVSLKPFGAFVEIDDLPEYTLCLLQKDLTANDDEIFYAVVSSGITYYKYYAILDNGEEKYYVETFEEAEKIVQDLKSKNSKNNMWG